MGGRKLNNLENLSDEERILRLRLIDDEFMRMIFEDNYAAAELVLNIIFNRNDIKLRTLVTQREIKNVNGHSVRFDIYGIDKAKNHYNVEVQKEPRGASAKRARFNSSMLDTKMLLPGEKPRRIANSYVIFITKTDIRKKKRPVYRFSRRDDDTYELLEDGSQIIFVNGAYRNNKTRIGRLMHDFHCTSADDMYYQVLADRVRYFKETTEGRDKVSEIIDQMKKEVALEATKVARMKALQEVAVTMIQDGQMSLELIAKYSNMSLAEVKKLI